jgi:hypothetical protein
MQHKPWTEPYEQLIRVARKDQHSLHKSQEFKQFTSHCSERGSNARILAQIQGGSKLLIF